VCGRDAGLAVGIRNAGPVAHQSAGHGGLAPTPGVCKKSSKHDRVTLVAFCRAEKRDQFITRYNTKVIRHNYVTDNLLREG
jgi:hypothetical protein